MTQSDFQYLARILRALRRRLDSDAWGVVLNVFVMYLERRYVGFDAARFKTSAASLLKH